MSVLDPYDVANFTTAQIAALDPNQVESLTQVQVLLLGYSQLASLSAAQTSALSASQLAGLDNYQVSSLTYLGSLSTQAIQSLDQSQVSGLTTAQLEQLGGAAISVLAPVQFSALSAAQVASLSVAQLNSLAPQDVANLQATSIGALSDGQVASLTADQLNALSAPQLQSLGTEQIEAIAPSVLSQLQPNVIRSLTASQVQALTAAQLGSLSSSQLADITATADAADPADASIASLTPGQIASMSVSQLQALTPAQISSLTAEQLQALGSNITELTPVQLASFTPTQILELTDAQIQSVIQPLADLGIQIVAVGGAPYTGGDTAGSDGSILAGDETASYGYVVTFNGDGSQNEVFSGSTPLPGGSFEGATGGTVPVAAAPSSPLTPIVSTTLATTTPSAPPPNGETYILETPFYGLAGSPQYVGSLREVRDGTVATTREYLTYAIDPNDPNFEIGYGPTGWDFRNITTGQGVWGINDYTEDVQVSDGNPDPDTWPTVTVDVHDPFTSYDAAYQAYVQAFGSAPNEYATYNYVDNGFTQAPSDGVHSFTNTAPPNALIGGTGVLNDSGDTTAFAPPGGTSALVVGGNGSATQTLSNLAPGQWYSISLSAMTTAFEEAAETGSGLQNVGRAAASPQTFSVQLDGVTIGTFSTAALTDTSDAALPQWQEFATAAFLGQSGQHTLTIQGLGPNGPTSSATIANLQLLQASPVGDVSEPSGGIASLTPSQIAALPAIDVVADNDDDLQQLNQSQFQALTPNQLALFFGAAINRFTPTQLSWLTPTQTAALGEDQLSWLGASVLNNLSAEQLQGFPNLGQLSTTTIQGLTASTLSEFTAAQIATLSRSQLAVLTPSQLVALNGGAWSKFSAAQISGLSTFQLAALPDSSIDSITTGARGGMPDVAQGLGLDDWLSLPEAEGPDGSLPTQTTQTALGLGLTLYDMDAPGGTPDFTSDFADPNLAVGTYAYDDTNTNARFSGTAGITADDSALSGPQYSPDGDDAAFIQGTGSVSEGISGLTAGEYYQVAFNTSQTSSSNLSFDVLVNGSVVGTFTPGQGYEADETDGFLVTSSGSQTITFQGLDTAGTEGTALLDSLHIALEGDAEVLSGGVTLQDGDFMEASAGVSSPSDTPSPSPWTFSGDSGIAAPFSAVYLASGGSISQNVAGFEAGETYEIAFGTAQNDSTSDQEVQVLVDNNVVGTLTPEDGTYRLETSATFAPGAGSHTITFRGIGGNGAADIINVRVLATGAEAADASISNGSFASTADWSFDSQSGIVQNNAADPTAYSGDSAAYVAGTGSLSQSVQNFQTGEQYIIEFRGAQTPGSAQSLRVLIDGTDVGTFTPGSAYGTFATSVFTAGPGTHQISFEGLGDGTALIDDVELVLLPDSPISEQTGSDGANLIDHIPNQDELQRLQWASLVDSVIQDGASALGGDDMVGVAPNMDGISAAPDPQTIQAFQLGWSAGTTSTTSIGIYGSGTIIHTVTNSDGSQYQLDYLAADPSQTSGSGTVTQLDILNAVIPMSANGAIPFSTNGAADAASSSTASKPTTTTTSGSKSIEASNLKNIQTILKLWNGQIWDSDNKKANIAGAGPAVVSFLQLLLDMQKTGTPAALLDIAQFLTTVGDLQQPNITLNPNGTLNETGADLLNDGDFMKQVSMLLADMQGAKKRGNGYAEGAAEAEIVLDTFMKNNGMTSGPKNLPATLIPGLVHGWTLDPTVYNSFKTAEDALTTLTALFTPLGTTGSLANDLSDTQKVVQTIADAEAIFNPKSAASIAMGNLAKGIGDVAGIVQGFEQGGVYGGINAGWSADALVKLLDEALTKTLSAGELETAIIIGVVVGLIALFFGGNHDKPQDMPDKYDTHNYGQGVANLQGVAVAANIPFTEDPNFKQMFGAKPEYRASRKLSLNLELVKMHRRGCAASSPRWSRCLAPLLLAAGSYPSE